MSDNTEVLLQRLKDTHAQMDAMADRQNARLMICIRTLAAIEALFNGRMNMRQSLIDLILS